MLLQRPRGHRPLRRTGRGPRVSRVLRGLGGTPEPLSVLPAWSKPPANPRDHSRGFQTSHQSAAAGGRPPPPAPTPGPPGPRTALHRSRCRSRSRSPDGRAGHHAEGAAGQRGCVWRTSLVRFSVVLMKNTRLRIMTFVTIKGGMQMIKNTRKKYKTFEIQIFVFKISV